MIRGVCLSALSEHLLPRYLVVATFLPTAEPLGMAAWFLLPLNIIFYISRTLSFNLHQFGEYYARALYCCEIRGETLEKPAHHQ